VALPSDLEARSATRAAEEPSSLPFGLDVLIVDHDAPARATLSESLQRHGLQVTIASSGSEAFALARRQRVDTIVVDLCLPDMRGTDVVRLLRRDGHRIAFILVSDSLTVPVTVEAMKLGALGVMEKPIKLEDLLLVLPKRPAPRASTAAERPRHTAVASAAAPPRSSAERWATYAAKACEAKGDLRTLDEWARFVGVSYSTLRESCRLLGIRPHDARDLVRMLRAIKTSYLHRCPPEVLLDISDRRTLKLLLERAGLEFQSRAWTSSIDDFLARQQFVAGDNEGLSVLRMLLASSPPGE
jgi:CheY-like chemotaxis protein